MKRPAPGWSCLVQATKFQSRPNSFQVRVVVENVYSPRLLVRSSKRGWLTIIHANEEVAPMANDH